MTAHIVKWLAAGTLAWAIIILGVWAAWSAVTL